MRVTVQILPTRKETKRITLEEGATAETAIRRLGLFPDQWIPLRDDGPIPIDEVLRDGDVLKIVAVVSGG
jgi:sulfur carrier protein ThiS